jgi:hypothetical protein
LYDKVFYHIQLFYLNSIGKIKGKESNLRDVL